MTEANLDAVARRRETPCLIFRPIKNTPLRGVFFVDGRKIRTQKKNADNFAERFLLNANVPFKTQIEQKRDNRRRVRLNKTDKIERTKIGPPLNLCL